MEEQEVRMKYLESRLREAMVLLVRAIPFIQRDFDRAAVGYGMAAKNLVKEATELLQEIRIMAEKFNFKVDMGEKKS